jgi:dienelactone hydrolase
VLQANYHGSSCYGLAWVESIAGHYYELEIPDLEAGVDAVIARGLADPERLASAGWSNGGILTVELLTRSKRYRAASVGAADVEWISDWGNVDFGASFDNYYFGAPPWETPQVYVEKSPFFRLPQVTTPTLVFSGTEDRNVPPHESWSLFRALQQIGKAPTRLVLFPGEPHSLMKVAHQRRKLQEELDWFDRYLLDKPRARRAAIKDGTPLSGLLGRAKAARVGSAFGRQVNGLLVPETVSFHGLDVGRFEVTQAQFAAFDPTLQIEPGSENLPLTGLSFARAAEYVAWLAKRTGKPFRLPTEEEARELDEAAAGTGSVGNGGNTLDRWVGYDPNPHDRKEIETELKALPGAAPLLLPVGSLAGAGDDPVFDLDGNAAEWAVGSGGKGIPVGPSADRPTDPRSDDLPGAGYVGLRVVLEEKAP